MRFKFKARLGKTGFLLLAVLAFLSGVVLPAWAATYVGYSNTSFNLSCPSVSCSCDNPICSANQCVSSTNSCEGVGDIVIAPFAGRLQSISFYTTPATCAPATCGLPNQLVILTTPGIPTHLSTPAGYCPTGGAGTPCGAEGLGDQFTIVDVEGLSGLTSATFTTVLLAGTVNVLNGQYVAIILQNTGNEALTIGQSMSQCPCLTTTFATQMIFMATGQTNCTSLSSNGPPVVNNLGCTDAAPSVPPIVGGNFVASTAPVTTITQCYGNCGSPAITLINPNATHSVNFNQSVTLFYPFQANVNGFLLNMTVNVAKSYTNGQGILLGVYTIASCGTGATPFSSQCPGSLQAQGNFVGNPNKGRFSVGTTGLSIPVSNGQWIGIAVTASLSGLDLNETNGFCCGSGAALVANQMFFTNGFMPSSITASAICGSTSSPCNFAGIGSTGLWAFITGNLVTGGPPTSPTGAGCGPGLDCILTNITNSFCTNVTATCQTGSGIFWVIMLTVGTMVVILYSLSNLLPGINLGRVGLGEIAILIFLGWLSMFTSLSLIAPWVIILVFFAIGWLFVGKAKGTGPI